MVRVKRPALYMYVSSIGAIFWIYINLNVSFIKIVTDDFSKYNMTYIFSWFTHIYKMLKVYADFNLYWILLEKKSYV